MDGKCYWRGPILGIMEKKKKTMLAAKTTLNRVEVVSLQTYINSPQIA